MRRARLRQHLEEAGGRDVRAAYAEAEAIAAETLPLGRIGVHTSVTVVSDQLPSTPAGRMR